MMFGELAFWQTVAVPLIVAVGVGRTVTVAVPVMVLLQAGAA